MKEITKDTIIGDILDADESCAGYFLEIGMHCLGCPASLGESLRDACMVHGVDAEAVVKEVNSKIAENRG